MDTLICVPDWLENAMDAEHYQRAQVLIEKCYIHFLSFMNQLYIPNSTLYYTAGHDAIYDSYQAMQSVAFWLFLTIRPIILFVYWMTYYFTYYVLYKFILIQGIYHHGLSQCKEILLIMYRYECQCTQQELFYQVIGVVLLYSVYQLQQFLKRRRYLYKLNLYMDRKKRKVIKSYHSIVQRIASISLLLAIMTPHALFLATAVGLKCLVPRLCSILVTSSGVRDILSWWYPLICTLLLLLDDSDNYNTESDHQTKDNKQTTSTTTAVDKENSTPRKTQTSDNQNTSSRTPEQQQRKRPLPKNGNVMSPFPRTTPKSTSSSSPRWNRTGNNTVTTTPYSSSKQRPRRRRQSLATPLRIITQQQQHFSSPTGNHNYNQQASAAAAAHHAQTLQEQEADWLRFWIIRGVVEASKVWFTWLTPIWLHPVLFHLEVLFYIWIYFMPYIQPESIRTSKHGDGHYYYYYDLPEGRPLQVLHDSYVQPAIEFLHDTVSGAVPQDTWNTYVVSNIQRITSALVLVWMISQETADAILHVVQESRSLVVPAITLFMPYFITSYGVVYVQYGLSIAKSTAAISSSQQHDNDNNNNNKLSSQQQQQQQQIQRCWLSYWVLHCTCVAILYRFQGLLWWIPFSTHVIFILWCALSIPRNINYVYNLACDELRAFNILPPTTRSHNVDNDDDAVVATLAWQETKTAKCLQWIWERLPKANNDDNLLTSFYSSTSVDSNHNNRSIHHGHDGGGDTVVQHVDDNEPNNDNPQLLGVTGGGGGGIESSSGQDDEKDNDEHYVMDNKNERNDDDYVPPLSSTSTATGTANPTTSLTAADTLSLRRSNRVARKSRNS